MGIFRRRRRDVGAASQADTGEVQAQADADDELAVEAGEPPQPPAPQGSSTRAEGPFDADEQPPGGDRLDLGSLQVPPVEGLQLQLEVDEPTGTVTALRLLLGGSHAHVQAFAAPRSAELWPDIRTEIADSIREQGGSAEVVDGPLGPELHARVPAGGPPLRFLGVDGPRWFLRAVLSGPAASDATAAAPLEGLVKGTVVVRGTDAMAPRELLPLRLPVAEPAPEDPNEAAGARTPLDPFRRGPEITEVR